jgi:hypothetical protein
VLEGQPLDGVLLVRDEIANMVWGVERAIALPSGEWKNGREAAYETRSFYERDLERRLGGPAQPAPVAAGAKVRYNLMTSVPENWIPMIPVHVPNDNRTIQLQRGSMLRIPMAIAISAITRARTSAANARATRRDAAAVAFAASSRARTASSSATCR